MYEAFYQLSANPFRLTPDPEYCFSYSAYRNARQYLDYALRLGEGFIMVTGQPGTGKTTLAERFLKDLDATEVAAKRIVASSLDADELLRAVAYSYGIEAEELDKATLRTRIHQYFARQAQAGWRALLIIDEAQGIAHSALEELRLLADMQAGSRPLLQLFLIGQEKLRDLMRVPEMEQFQQRVLATCHLTPLELDETRAYIEHRLCRAGWQGDPEWTGDAVVAIHRCSRGVPRHINKICNRLLLLGFGTGKHTLDIEDVRMISDELFREQLSPLENGEEHPVRIDAPLPEADLEEETPAAAELGIRRQRAARQDQASPVEDPTLRRPESHTALRNGRQAADRRVEAAVRARRERHPAGSPASRKPRVSTPAGAGGGKGFDPWRLLSDQLKWKVELAPALTLLVVATVALLGLATFPAKDHRDGEILSGVPAPMPVSMPGAQPAAHSAHPSTVAQVPEPGNQMPHDAAAGSAAAASRLPDPEALARVGPPVMRPEAGPAARPDPAQVAPASVAAPESGETGRRNAPHLAASRLPAEDAVLPGRETVAGSEAADSSEPEKRRDVSPPAETRLAALESDRRVPPTGTGFGADRPQGPAQPHDTDAARGGAGPAEAATPTTRQGEAGPAEPAGTAAAPAAGEPARAGSNRVLTDMAGLDPPAAGAAPGDSDGARDQAVTRPVSRQQRITALLARGEVSLARFRLLTPAEDSAYHYFQEVLDLDPGNADARAGIDRIVAAYVALSRTARQREEPELVRLYISRGLSIRPANRELLALRDSMRKAQEPAQGDVLQAAPAVEPEPEPPPQPQPQPGREGVFAWLKGLFTEARAGEAEVVERSVPQGRLPRPGGLR